MSNLKRSAQKKQLETRKTKLIEEVNALKTDLREVEKRLSNRKTKIKSIEASLKELNTTPYVSEHALLRYLERTFNLDLDAIKEKILTKESKLLIEKLGNGKYPIENGRKIIVKNKCVVSVV